MSTILSKCKCNCGSSPLVLVERPLPSCHSSLECPGGSRAVVRRLTFSVDITSLGVDCTVDWARLWVHRQRFRGGRAAAPLSAPPCASIRHTASVTAAPRARRRRTASVTAAPRARRCSSAKTRHSPSRVGVPCSEISAVPCRGLVGAHVHPPLLAPSLAAGATSSLPFCAPFSFCILPRWQQLVVVVTLCQGHIATEDGASTLAAQSCSKKQVRCRAACFFCEVVWFGRLGHVLVCAEHQVVCRVVAWCV